MDANFEKILLVNGTPIDSLGKGEDPQKPLNKDIYKNIYTTKTVNGKVLYTYNPNNNLWNSVLSSSQNKNNRDFMKKWDFSARSSQDTNPMEITRDDFGDIKANSLYKSSTPLLMVNASNNNINQNEWKIMPMKLSKILTDIKGVKSVHNLDKNAFFNNYVDLRNRKKEINEDFFEPSLVYVIYNDNDEVIDEFKTTNINLRFDDVEMIKHNAQAILSDYIRKDVNLIFVKDREGNWMNQPIPNKITTVYNITWMNRHYMFKNFENIRSFIKDWVKNNLRTIVVKG